MEADAIYFSRRASEERTAATKAVNPRAREAHLAMAARYDDLALGIARHEQRLGMDLFSAA